MNHRSLGRLLSVCSLAITFFSGPSSLHADDWVAGSIYQFQDDSRRPVRAAYVSARSLDGRLLATSRSAPDGSYTLQGLPPFRIVLASSRSGFYTVRAAGRAGTRVVVDCTLGCAEQAYDFELVRGGRVSGAVVDGLGEPVEGARVSARLLGVSMPGKQGLAKDTTDDRGRFRLAGLRGGVYQLTVQGRIPGRASAHRTQRLEISEGQEVSGLSITLGGEAVFRLSGTVTGLPISEYAVARVSLKRPGFDGRQLSAVADEEGRIEFPAVADGRYGASINATQLTSSERVRRFLGVIDVYGDMDGVVFRPLGMADVEGDVEFDGEINTAPFAVMLSAHEGGHSRWFRSTGEGEFRLDGLVAGAYRIGAKSPSVYVKGIRRGSEIESPDAVVLSPGTNRLTVVVAADHGEVFGTVRDPGDRRPIPHARVALEGRGGKNIVQADQVGRFLFGKVIPGEYRICAWSDIAPERVADEGEWERAGCENKIIPIDPDSEIEIDLTAAAL